MATHKTVLILIQESKTDNEKQTISRSRKTETAAGGFKKNTEHFFFYYCAAIYSIFEVQKFKTSKTSKTQVHSQGGVYNFTACFLCPTHSPHAKPSPAIPQPVTLFKQHYFFLRALFPSPFFGFSFPRSFFNRLISSLKS